jgi:hypothetical protein
MVIGYSGLVLSSNAALLGCHSDVGRADRNFDEPRVTPGLSSASVSAPPERAKPVVAEALSSRCDAGLISGPNLEVDVHRLGVLCGPTNGLTPLGPAFQLALAAPRAVASFEVDSRECVSAFVASASEPLELEWRSPERVLTRCRVGRLGTCPAMGPFCHEDPPSGKSTSVELVVVSPLPVELAGRVWHRKE